ncbi:MAG TPA: J domain-containing protein [Accumulibacter sp.]|nr:J domain-containing protein [Accumulibacter sp.]HMW16540.1 J domain-containing protein [Accumulibacter sp.]HNC18123.1 J domain-containing protein [Accumulibacter sp.]HND78962.1 J domain-containing protein [Accumulibacter sp.]HNE12056.1 J domain-containing protein [Accumulibacter sp.]
MNSSEDPFAILGVSPDASLTEIKQAYRRLAMHWHPDRNPAVVAETEFKRANAAYALLLDPQQLAAWRMALSGESAGGPPKAVRHDCTQKLSLTLEEAAFGGHKSIELTHRVRCDNCQGSGIIQHQNSVPCSACSGCGRVPRAGGRTGLCNGCGGKGYLRASACPTCAASGWRDDLRTLDVTVPPGLLEGERLRLTGQAPLPVGNETATPGDLYLEIKFLAHPLFVAEGRDLLCEVPVSIFRLLAGGPVDVPTLDGLASIDLSAYPQASLEFRLPGRGLPGKQAGDAAGDLVVHFESVYPNRLLEGEREWLDRLDQTLLSDCQERAPSLADWRAQLSARADSTVPDVADCSQPAAEGDQVG